ncbi:carbon-nitrogen hydrolase family protein [Guyparkeria hydrothermalis]|uniref:carbon-nitrogen hydrolase family protein n=1 Tax=Guyparkeria hydrothermalis TaxID=923 RepID=UPI0020223773|nr:carbon-nitrogen hydrolase family protein [Guyparkeria hydrothermalis]MCL7744232.1 carbon-nitrogen hydrolase family protein [Guyparkeria hydrothermalis]
MHSERPEVAVVQMNGRADWSANRPVVERLVAEAAEGGACLAVLPENLLAMPAHPAELVAMAERDTPAAIESLCDMARRHGIWLVAGTLPAVPAEGGHGSQVAARSLVIDAKGEVVAQYDKIHLFDVVLPDGESYRESATFRAGDSLVLVDTPAGRLGMATCFDLRFPELFARLARQGADWFCLPSAFTRTTGQAHWHVLTRARAIENSAWLVAAAQVGRHADGRETYGHSLVADPWGQVLVDAGNEPDCVRFARLDYEWLRGLRERFPVRRLHRPDLFDDGQ